MELFPKLEPSCKGTQLERKKHEPNKILDFCHIGLVEIAANPVLALIAEAT